MRWEGTGGPENPASGVLGAEQDPQRGRQPAEPPGRPATPTAALGEGRRPAEAARGGEPIPSAERFANGQQHRGSPAIRPTRSEPDWPLVLCVSRAGGPEVDHE